MSDPIGTTSTVDPVVPEPEQPAVLPEDKPTPKAKPAASAKSRSAKPKATDEPKHKCAFCGKTAPFEKTTTVGGRGPVTYHGCEESEHAVFEWMQATHADSATPALVTSED